jgi:hypothetical protein
MKVAQWQSLMSLAHPDLRLKEIKSEGLAMDISTRFLSRQIRRSFAARLFSFVSLN